MKRSDYMLLTVPEQAFGCRIFGPNWRVRYEQRIKTEQPDESQANRDEKKRRIKYITRDNTAITHPFRRSDMGGTSETTLSRARACLHGSCPSTPDPAPGPPPHPKGLDLLEFG